MNAKPWTSTDTDRLMAMFIGHVPELEIAAELDRTLPSIRQKVVRLRRKGKLLISRRQRRFDDSRLYISKVTARKLRGVAKKHTQGSVRSLLEGVVAKIARQPSLVDAILEQTEAAE